jgi:putative ABC transport system ATP-binding protein
MIRAEHLRKRYPNQQCDALSVDELHIEPGDHVSLVGASGSGKSTLLNLIGGLDRPTSGSLTVHGKDLGALSEDALAAWRGCNVGVVFQFFQLLPSMTLLENLVLAMDLVGSVPRTQRRERATDLLRQVGLHGLEARLPSQVSGGQQQRAAIARALANDPALVIADEPTGNLDSESAEGVLAVLDELVERGRTVVVVTHDARVAGRARRTIYLRDGHIVEGGAA